MLKVTKQGENRLDIELAGTLDSDTMRVALNDLIEHSENVRNGRMLYKIENFAFPTLGALGVEVGYLPKLFGLLGKFDKCAVLSDADWIRRAAELEGRLLPGMDIQAFEMSDVEAAEAWLAEEDHSVPV